MRIIAVHLLNDYSGSPKVLMQLLQCWTKANCTTLLYTSGGRQGFLSNIPKVTTNNYWYPFVKNKFLRLLYLLTSQFILAILLLRQLQKTDVLYINTVLPFGAAIAGKIVGCKVIYHIHETSIKPKILKKILFLIVQHTASEVVYVSHFLANQEPLKLKKTVLYNVLERDFQVKAKQSYDPLKKSNIILMICSLKSYKGVNEFLALAKRNQEFIFKLVVNASEKDIALYFKDETLPNNLLVYPTQTNTHPFYAEAAMILNLSDTQQWVETFGLTILEGMAYGLPAIVPPVGGVTEVVENNGNGFWIDSKELDLLSDTIHKLLNDPVLYVSMSQKALEKSEQFNTALFEKEALCLISN